MLYKRCVFEINVLDIFLAEVAGFFHVEFDGRLSVAKPVTFSVKRFTIRVSLPQPFYF